jgi:type II secretory pathway component GspD/PulD (secretin)
VVPLRLRSLHRLIACAILVAGRVSADHAQTPASLPVVAVDFEASTADAAGRLSMTAATPIQIRVALQLLVRGTGFRVVLDPAVSGMFTGDLKNVTLRQALEAVLRPRRLAYTIDGTVIRVYPHRTEARFFAVDFVDVRRTWQRTLPQTDGSSFSIVSAGDPFDDVQRSVDALLSPDGRAHVDRHAGLVVVSDYPERLDRVAAYVEALESRSLRLVRLQIRLVDSAAKTTVPFPELAGVNNEAVVMRTTDRSGATFALTIVPQVDGEGFIQLSVSPSWSDGTGRSGAADLVSRVRSGGTIVVPIGDALVVEVTATAAERAGGM